MIENIIAFLNNNYDGEDFFVKEFVDEAFFGKDKEGNYVFAKTNNSKENSFSFNTKNITLYQNTPFVLKTDNGEIEGTYDVLILTSFYPEMLPSFVSLCLNFYNNQKDRSLIELTEDLIQLYKTLGTGDYSAQQGFWAELFTIIHLYSKYGINVINYWHTDPYNKYDFSINEKVKIEVKSTIKEYREHEFSHDQIYTNNEVYVSSVMMKKDDQGKTILDLFNQIKDLFIDNYEVAKMLEVEMAKYAPHSLLKFDYNYSENNIRFYLNSDVPKFEMPEPDGVHGTVYLAQLENVEQMSDEEIGKLKNYII